MKYQDYAEQVVDGLLDKSDDLWFSDTHGECNDIIQDLFKHDVTVDKAVEHVIDKRKSLLQSFDQTILKLWRRHKCLKLN